MNFNIAKVRAEKVVEWLTPHCERLEIVGSIRRERPICNDIDIVAIPKMIPFNQKVDLLTTQMFTVNALRGFLIEYVRLSTDTVRPKWLGKKDKPGPEPKETAQNLLLITSKGVQLDVWCATEETLITRMLCRTGSVAHNIWCCQRAEQLKGHWNPYEGLTLHGEPVPLKSEQDFYKALNLPYLPPNQREPQFFHKLLQP